MPDEITRLNEEVSKTMFESRGKERRVAAAAAEKVALAQSFMPAPRPVDMQRRQRQFEKDKIEHLTLLSNSPFASLQEKQKYGRELFEYIKSLHGDKVKSEVKSEDQTTETEVSEMENSRPVPPTQMSFPAPSSDNSGSSAITTPVTPFTPGSYSAAMISDLSSSSKTLCKDFELLLCDQTASTSTAPLPSASQASTAPLPPASQAPNVHPAPRANDEAQEALEFANSCLQLASIMDLTVHKTPTDGSCCPAAILESLRYLKPHGVDIPPSAQHLRDAVLDYIETNPDVACPALFDLTFRESVRTDYVLGRRELRDSDYIKAAMEAQPQEDPVQRVSSFMGYTCAMRRRRAYGDELFVAAAAMVFKAQICVVRSIQNVYTATFYHNPDDAFYRIFLFASEDHYEWCHPTADNVLTTLPRLFVPWTSDVPSLATTTSTTIAVAVPVSPPLAPHDDASVTAIGPIIIATAPSFVALPEFGTQTQAQWVHSVRSRWHVVDFPPGVDNFFAALVQFLNANPTEAAVAVQQHDIVSVRSEIASHILINNGIFDGFDEEGFDECTGCITLKCVEKSVSEWESFTLAEYCRGIETDWPAGNLEIYAAAQFYKMRFKIFEHETPVALYYYNKGECDVNKNQRCKLMRCEAAKDCGNRLDSYSLLRSPKTKWPPFHKHHLMSQRLPLWNVDIKVVTISKSVGRGVIALRRFRKDEVVGIYDGYRVDDTGKLVIARDAVTAVFRMHPNLNRHRAGGGRFKKSHSVSLGRSHCSGLVIDGHPLCDPSLDNDINSLGRCALCNSAASDSAGACCRLLLLAAAAHSPPFLLPPANIKPKWVPAPDLPPDPINHIANCECFMIATRDIDINEELLWNYPIAHHLSPANRQRGPQPQRQMQNAPVSADAVVGSAPSHASSRPPQRDIPSSMPPAAASGPTASKRARRGSSISSPPKQRLGQRRKIPDDKDKDEEEKLDPLCVCPNQEKKCKMGRCWFYGGRTIQGKRR
jgi:hypothetical protein